jgi:uncharacterized ParB-like nuclease family protein
MSRDIHMPLSIDDILIGEGRRAVNDTAVKRLAASIDEIGLRHPITVRKKGEQYLLIAGRHRLEACRKLGREHVPAIIVSMSNGDARKWEIAENLHRADLSKLERDELVAEWINLTEVSSQSERKPQGGRPEGGLEAAARELGVERNDAHRAVRVASISEEAKDAARDAGLDDNRSALLKVAAAPAAQQTAVVRELAERRASKIDGDVKDRAAHAVAEMLSEHVPGAAWDALKANLYAAGAANIANALTNITGEAIMDRRFK